MHPSDVLVLVNENSPTSRYVAKLYRKYYPGINESQVLYLSGLADCSGPQSNPENEIITRQQYNDSIAEPVRNYLADLNYPERITTIKVIITTAGMPYRIKDSDPAYGNAIYPAGSNPGTVKNNLANVDIASVESELTCLWYSDYGSNPFGPENRMVNPYQGYSQSSISLFERLPPDSNTFLWTNAYQATGMPPKIEGENEWSWPDPAIYGAINRSFNAGDIYLTCRLDGPKNQGQSAIFSVRAMLERAKRASNPNIGVNPAGAVVVLDDAPAKALDRNRIYNLDGQANYIVYDPAVNQPPDARSALIKYDYTESYIALTNQQVNANNLNINFMDYGYNLEVMLDQRAARRLTQADLDAYAATDPNRQPSQAIIALATYGCNGDEDSTADYLLHGGPASEPLFKCTNGAVFASIESLNAVTMFSNVATSPVAQGKIVDFISIGGTGAIGHAFEPVSEAVIDNLYLQYNLLADEDGDGFADLAFAEAAFTAIPFLSWAEVVIGDPLMQIAYGPGQKKAWSPLSGDANNDGRVNFFDTWLIQGKMGGTLNTTNEAYFAMYDDLCDINKDGRINMFDMWLAQGNMGALADW
ncbi:MAG: dockerin type I domain-containing protein [Phycisphaerae bacterium]|nr:dockerin type I domain-containing protein [Phycisphaerae bacterium]MDD5381959.1 dockerin type I domain-containing protein [Phycisphaerae bacterium]